MNKKQVKQISPTSLKKAIENADWDGVCSYYFKMTGKVIKPPVFEVVPIDTDGYDGEEEEEEVYVESSARKFRRSDPNAKVVFAEDRTVKKDEKGLYSNLKKVSRNSLGRQDTSKKVRVVCSGCDGERVVLASQAIGYSPNEDNNYYKCPACQKRSRR